MDITVLLGTSTSIRPRLKGNKLAWFIGCFLSPSVLANWTFNPELETTLNVYNKVFSGSESIDNTALSVVPKINAIYDGLNNDVAINLTHTNLISNDKNVAENRNYDEYTFSSDSNIFANLVNLQINLARIYKTKSQADSFSLDILDNAESFLQDDKSSIQLGFNLPNSDVLNLRTSFYASENKSEQLQESSAFFGYDSNTVGGQIMLSGAKTNHLPLWRINANYSNTKRENRQDYESLILDGKISLPVFSQTFRLVFVGRQEDNQVGSIDGEFSDIYDQSSYGAGIEWNVSETKYLTLTYNRTEKSLDSQEQEYLGVDFNWVFSQRNKLNASYDKRFYGDAFGFGFEHIGRMLQVKAIYQEDVSTQSKIKQDVIPGVLVCPQGEVDITNCFQAQPGYELQPGEQGMNFSQSIPELSDEVYLRKNANIGVSWVTKKLTLALNLNKASIDYLESSRGQDSHSVILSSSWILSRKTRFNVSANYLSVLYNEQIEKDITQTISVGISRQLGRSISTRWDLSYLDRESPFEDRSFIDKRLTASLIIKY